MIARRLGFAVILLLSAPVVDRAAAQGTAPAAPLTVGQGDIFTDPVGSVIGVSVVNGGSSVVGSAVVTCAFTDKGRPAGSASTTIYNILPGAKGQDQVHLMGARADKASCAVTATTPAAN